MLRPSLLGGVAVHRDGRPETGATSYQSGLFWRNALMQKPTKHPNAATGPSPAIAST